MYGADETVIDLFSGAGFMSYGVHMTFPIIQAIDIKTICCQSYKCNFPKTQVLQRDIRDISFTKQDFQGIIGIIAGPPCQDFSVLNQRKDENSDRANLLFEFIRAVEEIRPTFFLLENVASVPKAMKTKIVHRLRDLHYNVISKVINASNYGSVQIRRRWITTGCMTKLVFPSKANRIRTASEILTKNNSELSMTQETYNAIQKIQTIGKWVSIHGQKYKAYCIVDPKKPIPTVANPTKLRYIKPDRSGYLTLSELIKCFDVPETFIVKGTLSEIGQQIANGFPAAVAYRFSLAFKQALEN